MNPDRNTEPDAFYDQDTIATHSIPQSPEVPPVLTAGIHIM